MGVLKIAMCLDSLGSGDEPQLAGSVAVAEELELGLPQQGQGLSRTLSRPNTEANT